MKTIIITGVAGLIGSNLSHWILNNTNDIKIIGIDNLSGGIRENIPMEDERFIFHKISVEDETLNTIFQNHKPDYVYHLSAWAAECCSPFMRKHNVINNLLSTSNVINNCINFDVKRLIFASSMSVYGDGNGTLPPYSEEMVPSPVDSYAITKYACELDLKVAGTQHNLDWTIIRPHNVYGKRQVYFDRYRNVLGIWMFKYLKGLPLTIFGDGLQVRSFSYIDDTLPCLYKAITQPNCSKQIINVGGIHETTILKAAQTLIEVFREDGNPFGESKLIHLEPRHEVREAYPTYQKSIDLLGFEHKTDLYDGLKEMWKWAKADYTKHQRKQLSFDHYEIEKGLYEYWKNK